jgi:hypothetical protein
MKSSLVALLFGATLASAGVAQAQVKQTRPVAAFEAVQAGGGIDVILSQGPAAAVVVEADAAVQAEVSTTVQNGKLLIGWLHNDGWKKVLSSKRKVNVYVTCPRLTSVSMSGGSDARSESTFAADNFRVNASGGGDIKLQLNVRSLTGEASGGSDITLAGRAERQSISVGGGSDYNAFALQSQTAEVHASGGSDANVNVDGELTLNASGGSDVHYKGKGRIVSSHTSGGGEIHLVR